MTQQEAFEGPCELTVFDILAFHPDLVEVQEPELDDIPVDQLPAPEELFDFENPAERINRALNEVYEGPETCNGDGDPGRIILGEDEAQPQ